MLVETPIVCPDFVWIPRLPKSTAKKSRGRDFFEYKLLPIVNDLTDQNWLLGYFLA
jgi:hypothetical protein